MSGESDVHVMPSKKECLRALKLFRSSGRQDEGHVARRAQRAIRGFSSLRVGRSECLSLHEVVAGNCYVLTNSETGTGS